MVKLPNTLRDLALQLLFLSSTIPSILPVISTKVSLSKVINAVLEVSDKFVICCGEVGIPSNFKNLLSDRDKERMFERIKPVWIENVA